MFKNIQELCDCVSVFFFCPDDDSILVSLEGPTTEFWIPTVRALATESWSTLAQKGIVYQIFGVTIPLTRILRLNKVRLFTANSTFLQHCVFEAIVDLNVKKRTLQVLGKHKGKIHWVTEAELFKLNLSNNLRGPEVIEFLTLAQGKPSFIKNIPNEHIIIGNFLEINENVLVKGTTAFDDLVEVSGIKPAAQEQLYREFTLLCYPSNYMSLHVFSRLLGEMGWNRELVPSLYNSADLCSRKGISFRELILFLAAVEPDTPHGGTAAEMRCRYIFRFLDVHKNGLLRKEELRNYVVMLRKSRDQSITDHSQVEADLSECYQTIGYAESHALTMMEFLKAVGELKLRGTSQIYRAPFSIHKYLKELTRRHADVLVRSSSVNTSVIKFANAQMAKSIKSITYDLAIHMIKFNKGSVTYSADPFVNIREAISDSTFRQPVIHNRPRRSSLDHYNQNSTSNELLSAINYLYKINKKMPAYVKPELFSYQWGQLDSTLVSKSIVAVCSEVKEILRKEPRLLEVQSPVYVLGDFHGNLTDLFCFQRIFWNVNLGLCPARFLFLGDFVDRGMFSWEVIMYLFAYKVQNPQKLNLIRGNHEVKRVQIQWTFEKECKIKFGEKLGNYMFTVINDVFDVLPLAAVIDEKIFCCHGGIPPPWLCPVASAINEIPVYLPDPQANSLAWELLWNDPINIKQMNEKVAIELIANDGFAFNNRRGTAHVFNMEALDRFLAVNGYTHMMRAHEVMENGFYLQFKGRLMTVFSSSNYCGLTNQAVCILVDQGAIRIMRIDSSE